MKKKRIKENRATIMEVRRLKAIECILATKGKNIKKCLLEAGYGPAYAANSQHFMNTKEVRMKLDWFKYECEEIRKRMDKTRNKARYKELSDSYLGLKKLHQLLGGNPTEIIKITDKEKKAVDDAFGLNT